MISLFDVLILDIEIRASTCRDTLPQKFSKKKQCKKLRNSCSKLKKKCNSKWKSKGIMGSSGQAKRCINSLSSKDRNAKVKDFCGKTCKVCSKWVIRYKVILLFRTIMKF